MGAAVSSGRQVAGRYLVDQMLGQGGMGTVWAATEVATGRRVALKVLQPDASGDDGKRRQRFLREASTARAARHPNIIAVEEMIDDDGTPVMVMELLQGEPLDHHLERTGGLSLGEAASILLPVVSAVGTCHEQGIVHRDLKPANIFLAEEGDRRVVKVLDFGVAKLIPSDEAPAETALTNTGAPMGTCYYMAPEQCSGARDIDHRADVWALGIILYECLSGKRPITGDNPLQIINKVLTEPVPPLAAQVPGLPADVYDLVGRMLARGREDRPEDLREVRAVLEKHAGQTVPEFGPASLKTPSSGEPPRSRWRWKIVAGTGPVDPEGRTADINSGADLAASKGVPAPLHGLSRRGVAVAGVLVGVLVGAMLVVGGERRGVAPGPPGSAAPREEKDTGATAGATAEVTAITAPTGSAAATVAVPEVDAGAGSVGGSPDAAAAAPTVPKPKPAGPPAGWTPSRPPPSASPTVPRPPGTPSTPAAPPTSSTHRKLMDE
jgi:serine/threonine-protein kinase